VTFLRFSTNDDEPGLIFLNDGVGSVTLGAPIPPPAGLSPAWLVEYVDTAGARQRIAVNNNGTTAITIRQYANITVDGRASRSTAVNCDLAWGAAQLMGFGMDYGEALGGVWPTSGNSRDFNIGPPIFSRCYTRVGACTAMLYIRDPEGRESAIPLTINVLPLGSITDISAGGSWPSWVDGGVYGLVAGDYNSRGPISLPGRYGIRIVKLGGGADPVVGQFRPESRGLSHGSVITSRSKDNVLVNIDYAKFAEGPVGTDYCGSYGGRCRHYGDGELMPKGYLWDNAGIVEANPINAANVRHSRGAFVVASGIVGGSTEGLTEYCLIGGGRSMNFAGTTFARTTGTTGGNPMRTYMDSTVLRDTQIYSTTPTFGLVKGSLYSCIYQAEPTLPWPEDDSWGDYNLSRSLYLANGVSGIGAWTPGPSYFWICDNRFGGPGNYDSATYVGGWNPQNALIPTNGLAGPWTVDSSYESGEIGGWERNRLLYNTGGSITTGGRHLSQRDNLQLSGAPVNSEFNSNWPRIHPNFRGPYITTPRPVHSVLAARL